MSGAPLRAFYAAGRRPNAALEDSTIWRANLLGALEDLGHDVIEFQYDLEPLIDRADLSDAENRRYVAEHRPQAEAALLQQLARAHAERPVDVFFSYFYDSCATPATIRRIRDLGIVTMNWYCNASYQLDLVKSLSPAYDWCLVPEKYRLDDYRAIGARPVYCQEAANPRVYHPYDLPREYDVVFVGACYAERPDYIKALSDAGVDVHAWGPGWPNCAKPSLRETSLADLRRVPRRAARAGLVAIGKREPLPIHARLPRGIVGPPLSDEAMVQMYSRAKIALGFSTVGATHTSGERITQIRLRDFEAPMAGAFYMVECMDELEEFFDVGREVVCYESAADLVEKCRYFLAHDDERETIRAAGHARALRDHTWQDRLRQVFEQCLASESQPRDKDDGTRSS